MQKPRVFANSTPSLTSSVPCKEMKQRHKPSLMIQTAFHKSPTSCKMMIKFPEFPTNPIFY